jgi:hypothetical protein
MTIGDVVLTVFLVLSVGLALLFAVNRQQIPASPAPGPACCAQLMEAPGPQL